MERFDGASADSAHLTWPAISTAPSSVRVEGGTDVVHIAHTEVSKLGYTMDELNGRMMACQILITGLIARVANDSSDPLRFLTDFRDEIRAVVKGVNIAGLQNTDRVRQVAQSTVDELFSLMKPPSTDEFSEGDDATNA